MRWLVPATAPVAMSGAEGGRGTRAWAVRTFYFQWSDWGLHGSYDRIRAYRKGSRIAATVDDRRIAHFGFREGAVASRRALGLAFDTRDVVSISLGEGLRL